MLVKGLDMQIFVKVSLPAGTASMLRVLSEAASARVSSRDSLYQRPRWGPVRLRRTGWRARGCCLALDRYDARSAA